MTTKRIRCSCGRVYDSAKRPACPDCGAASPVAVAPESSTPPLPRIAEPPPLPAPACEKSEILGTLGKENLGPGPGPLTTALPRKYLIIGAVVMCLLALLIFVARRGGSGKAVVNPTPAATPIATATSTASPIPTATTVVRQEVATPSPSLAQGTATPPPQQLPNDPYDLATLIANAAPDATIKVRPGTYSALTLTRPIRLVGDTNLPVFIKGEGRAALSVKSSGVVLQNIQILCQGIGSLPAVVVTEGAALEMSGGTLQSGTTIGVLVEGRASFKAVGINFNVPSGAGVSLTNQAKANLTQCTLSNETSGLIASGGASAELHSCAFQSDGGPDGRGAIIALNGEGTSVTGEDCHFNNNRAGVIASQGARLVITQSSFQGNDAGAQDGMVGLVSVRKGAKATLTGNGFESNRQGVALIDGGTAEIEQCKFVGNGQRSQQIVLGSLPLTVTGEKSRAVVHKTDFASSAQYAIGVGAGGSLNLEDVNISDSRNAGVILGERGTAPASAEMKRTHIRHSGTGLGLVAGSKADLTDCEFRDNNDGIIVIDGGSQLKAAKTSVSSNRNRGLYVYLQATASLIDCDLKNNARGAQSGTKGKSAEHAFITLENCRFGSNRVFGAGAATQSEINLTNCVFDGSDKTNLYREAGANVQINGAQDQTTSPQDEDDIATSPAERPNESTSPTPAHATVTPKPHRKPTPRPHPPTPDDIRRTLKKLLPGGS